MFVAPPSLYSLPYPAFTFIIKMNYVRTRGQLYYIIFSVDKAFSCAGFVKIVICYLLNHDTAQSKLVLSIYIYFLQTMFSQKWIQMYVLS